MVAKLTFDQVTNRSCFNVTTVGDQILEDTENLNLDLSTLDRNVTLLPGLAQVSIRDNYRSEIVESHTHFFLIFFIHSNVLGI